MPYVKTEKEIREMIRSLSDSRETVWGNNYYHTESQLLEAQIDILEWVLGENES